MCDPLTIAGIALTGASVAANSAAASSVARARSQALQAERSRQQALDTEAAGYNNHARDTYSTFQNDQTAKAQQLGDYFNGQAIAPPPASAALPTSSSNLVVNEQAKQGDIEKAFANKTGTALGNLRAFGDVLGADSRTQARDAGYVGQVNNFKQGSSGVVPYELDSAGHAGDSMKLFGDVLGGAGSLAIGGGLSGKGLFGFGAAAPKVAASPLGGVTADGLGNYLAGATPRLGALY